MFLITPEKKSILDLTLTSSTASTPSSPTTVAAAVSATSLSQQTSSNLKTNTISGQEREEGVRGGELGSATASISETSKAITRGLLQYLIHSSTLIVRVFINYYNPLKQWFIHSFRTLFTILGAIFWPKPGTQLTGTGSTANYPISWLQARFYNYRSVLMNLKTLLDDEKLKHNHSSNSNHHPQSGLWIKRTCAESSVQGYKKSSYALPTTLPEPPIQHSVISNYCGAIKKYFNMDLCNQRWRNTTQSAASFSRTSAISPCNWPQSSQAPIGEGRTSFKSTPPPPPLLMLGECASSSLSFAGRRHLPQSHHQNQYEQQQTWMPAQGHSDHHRNHHHSSYGALQIETNSGASEVNTDTPTLVQLPTNNQYTDHYSNPLNIAKGSYDQDFHDHFGRHNRQQQQQEYSSKQQGVASNLTRRHSFLSSTLLSSSDKHDSNFTSNVMQSFNASLERSRQLQADADYHRRRASISMSSSTSTSTATSPLVLVSKDALSDLTNKVKGLEEQVRVIPELQRRLDHVINDSNESTGVEFHHRANMSTGGFSINRNTSSTSISGSQRLQHSHNALDEKLIRKTSTNDMETHTRGNSPLLQRQYTWIKSSSVNTTANGSHNNNRDEQRSTMTNGSLSLQTTPVKHPTTPLDCGCQSFKEHLRYNSISRENRLNYTKYQSIRCTRNNNNISPQPLPSVVSKVDASTNTDLCMEDVLTREELNRLLAAERKAAQANISSYNHISCYSRTKSSSINSEQGTTGSLNEQKSSSPPESQTDSCGDDEQPSSDHKPLKSFSRGLLDDLENLKLSKSSESRIEYNNVNLNEREGNDFNHQEEDDDDDDEDRDSRTASSNGDEPSSLGSSYHDPSDFEEYRAYGESLDRRTKDFISTSTKLPNDLKFALIRLNDLIKKKRSLNQVESTSSCLDIIRKAWFDVSTKKDSQSSKVKLYIDYIESMTKQLLNLVVNLIDSAGNTAMHYAASDCKLDIIKILLDTKVCDINSRNKAGYTPIMLLALAELNEQREQEIARQLFSLGDVNIMAQSSGQTALMLAASHGRVSTCKLLLECGANPSLQDYDGSTALMCGSEIGNEEVVRCLLAHKLTDLTATDNDGLDALTIAMNNGHKKIGLMLYAAKNVPRMTRSSFNRSGNTSGGYLGASLRRTRGKASNIVRRADSLLNRSRLSGYS